MIEVWWENRQRDTQCKDRQTFEIVMQIVESKSLIFSSGDVISTTSLNIADIFGGIPGFGGFGWS